MSSPRFAVVGAGPAGLITARLLQLRGESVTVYERDRGPEPRRGGSLDLKPDSGLLAIEHAGLADAFRKAARGTDVTFRVIDPVTLDVRFEDDTSAQPEIDRADLRDLLLDSLAPGTVEWGRELAGVEADGAGYRLDFRDGTTASASFVVGCDGSRSRVRPLLTPVGPRHIGVTITEVTVAAPIPPDLGDLDVLLGGGSLSAVAGGVALWLQRARDGGFRAYFSHPARETDPPVGGGELRARFAHFAPRLLAILDHQSADARAWRVYACPPEQTWQTRPGITVIGDAAHVMPPFTGEGVNQAFLDASHLVRALPDSLARFEAEMRRRTATEIARTLDVARERYGAAVVRP